MQVSRNIKFSEKEFHKLKNIIYEKSGIFITSEHQEGLENRLGSRLDHYNLDSFDKYYDVMTNDDREMQTVINMATTNETYFFREHKHYEFLKEEILPKVKYDLFRSWSAAGSNGAEAYSTAMLIDSNLSAYQNWEVVTSDINDEVLEFSKRAIYPMRFAKKIPIEYLKNYCQRGQNEDEGFFKIGEKIKKHLKYMHINLTGTMPSELGMFDVVFLRNMIIYFDDAHKKVIVENVIRHLKPGGYLFMGHSESLYRITDNVTQVRPSIYKKTSK